MFKYLAFIPKHLICTPFKKWVIWMPQPATDNELKQQPFTQFSGRKCIWAASWQNQQNGMYAQRRHRPVWSESSLSAWRKLGSLTTHWAHSKDWSDWADAQAYLSHRWADMSFCWFCHEAAHLSIEIPPKPEHHSKITNTIIIIVVKSDR